MTERADADGQERSRLDRELFDRIASEYGTKDLLPAVRVARRRRTVATWPAEVAYADQLLDVGCGAGFASVYLDGLYGRYTGIDYSEELIRLAGRLNERDDRQFLVRDAMTFVPPVEPDVIFMVGVLHHMPDPRAALRHFFKILKPGGWLVANEPQATNPVIQGARRIRGRIDRGYSDDQDQYRPSVLRRLAQDAGFSSVRSAGQGLLTTPFAEVRVPGQRVLAPWVGLLSGIDAVAERTTHLPGLSRMTWNVVLTAHKAP